MTPTGEREVNGGNVILRVVSVSGGKDSTALYLWAIEQWGKDGFRAVFADTGHEHPVTYNYVRNMPEMAKGPEVEWVKADFSAKLQEKGKPVSNSPFQDLIVWKGRAPSARAQFCTEHLKLRPIKEWLEAIRGDAEVVMYTGIRAGESERRSKMPEREWADIYDCYTERPLLRWTEEEVFAFIKSRGVEPNPLYANGSARVGCYPCIHSSKAELASMPDWAWDRIEQYEKTVGRSWFSAGKIPGVFIPTIQDVKEWSKTARGGVQFEMFSEDAKDVPSCMSTWGACE